MILLVTPSTCGKECVKALTQATGEQVVVAETLRHAATALHNEAYRCVVFDQYLLEAEPSETEALMQHLGLAMPVQVNFGITGMDRLVREVRAALARREREESAARIAAEQTLHCELTGTLTALLLSCELALSSPELPTGAQEKMRAAHDLVLKLRDKLEPVGAEAEIPTLK
jgi:hypothetical protein